MWKKGYNPWILPNRYGYLEGARLAKAAGFDGLEVVVGLDQGEIHLETPLEDIKRFVGELHEIGLEVPSVLPLNVLPNIATNDLGEKTIEVAEERLVRLAQILKVLGTDTLLLVPGGLWQRATRYDLALDNATRALSRLARVAEGEGIILAVENVWNRFLLSPVEMRNFIDSAQSENVKAYFDVGNILVFGEPTDWIEILGARIHRIHLKDFKKNVGNLQTYAGFANLLEGDVPWPDVMASLRKIGYEGYLTLELSPWPNYPVRLLEGMSKALDILTTE